MLTENRDLSRPPIVEAVIDIDCDMPPNQKLESLLDEAKRRYRQDYPKIQPRFQHQVTVKVGEADPPSASQRIHAYLFSTDDGKQLVQVRSDGFSFNRLAPYTHLDDYLLQIESGWKTFIEVASPVRVNAIKLRYINRLLLPIVEGKVNLEEYLKQDPRLPGDDRLALVSFLNQHVAVERATGHEARIILASQNPEGEGFPIILDIAVSCKVQTEPAEWAAILSLIQVLRRLKNDVFFDTVTEKCLALFK